MLQQRQHKTASLDPLELLFKGGLTSEPPQMLQVGSHIYFANTVKQCTQHNAKHVLFEVSSRVVNTKAGMKRVHRFLQFYV